MRARYRQAFCDALPGPRVLEVGSGPGTDAKALADAGLIVTATDLCETFVAIVQERYPELTALQADMRDLPFDDASFDGVCGFGCFIHLSRPDARVALQEFARVLAPGGALSLGLITSDQVRDYVIDDWGGVPNNPVRFVCWGPDELGDLLRRTGFGGVEHRPVLSPVYEQEPRLVSRGVRLYQVTARREESGA